MTLVIVTIVVLLLILRVTIRRAVAGSTVTRRVFLYQICPVCGPIRGNVEAQSRWADRMWARVLGSLRFGLLTDCACRVCGTRWTTWPALEVHFELTWRGFSRRNPGEFSATEFAELLSLRAANRAHDLEEVGS